MTCPNCGSSVSPEPIVGRLTICPSCLRTLVVEGEQVWLARADATVPLSQQDLAKLRKARKQAREAPR